MGGRGQERILAGTVLLHGNAPLCAVYLAAAGLGRLLVTGDEPPLAAHDPALRIERCGVEAAADVVIDLHDGAAARAAEGEVVLAGARGRRVRVGAQPDAGPDSVPAAQSLVEILAAGEALRRLAGLPARTYDFTV